MRLAKPQLDVGFFACDRDAALAFWGGPAGLPFDHTAKLGGGIQQHRFLAHGAVVKINHAREPLPAQPPSGFAELRIARPGLTAPLPLRDPDGTPVVLLPSGMHGVSGIGVVLRVNDPDASERFYRDAMQFPCVGPRAYLCGDSVLQLVPGRVERPANWRAPGFRYLTVQVFDCEAEHRGVLERGGEEGAPPRVLGDVVRFSFVRDPDGNFIELSQKTVFTGAPL